MVDRQRQQQQVELPADKLPDERLRLRLADVQLELGVLFAQDRQQRWQQIGRDGGNDAEPERTREQLSAMAGILGEVTGGSEHALGTPRHLGADIRERHGSGTPLDKLGAESLLELTDLHGERRLRHGALLRGPAEMKIPRKGVEVAELPECHHADKVILWLISIKPIRLYWLKQPLCARSTDRRRGAWKAVQAKG